MKPLTEDEKKTLKKLIGRIGDPETLMMCREKLWNVSKKLRKAYEEKLRGEAWEKICKHKPGKALFCHEYEYWDIFKAVYSDKLILLKIMPRKKEAMLRNERTGATVKLDRRDLRYMDLRPVKAPRLKKRPKKVIIRNPYSYARTIRVVKKKK